MWKFEGEAEEAVGEAVTTSNVLPSSSSSSSAPTTSRWLFSPQPSSLLPSLSSSSPAPVYKIAPATHTAQSVLNAAACLIVVSLTNLWSYLHTLVVKTVWISVCANYYQSVITEANKTINLIAAAVTLRRGLNTTTAFSSSSTLSSTTELESTVVVESSEATPPVAVLAKVFNTTPVTETTETAKMTIEVPAEYSPAQAALPVLRINSVNIEDPLLLESTQFLMSSSDGEDHDHLFTDDGELSSSNERGMGNQSMMRRDSDTSDVSSTDGSTEDHCESAPELTARIINQVENMFSDEHLSKDGFLLKHVRRRSDGFVSLKLVAGLRKVKQISREFPVILSAVQKSDKLEVNSEGTKIRRVEPLTTYLKSLPIASQKSPKEKEVLSKSPSSSGDDLPGR